MGSTSSLVEDAFVNDPYFLDQLAYYTAIRKLVSDMGEEILKKYLASLETPQATAPQSLSTAQASPVRSLSASPNRNMTMQNTLGETFWWPSPWNNGEPWVWYGETTSLDVTLPPFPALSLSQPSLIASANPTMMNYVLEMYDESGAKIAGPDGRDWYLVGRNSTLVQKATNSDAAQTLHNPDGIFSNRPAHIEYNKYWLTSGDTAPTNIVRTLNILHLGSGILNVVADANFITSYLKRTEKLLGKSGNREDLIDIFIVCGTGLVSTVDFTSDSIPAWIKDNSFSVLETSTTGCLLPLVEFYGKDAMKEAVNSFLTGAFSKLLGKFSNPAGWAVIVLDAANDLAPFGISMFKADSLVGYDLSYNADGQLMSATRNDKRPNKALKPQAKIDVLSLDGLAVTFSAAGSEFDQSANPGFEWGFGDGNVGSGETVSHNYSSAGIKDVRLTIYDGLGQQNEVYAQVELTNGQPPIIQSTTCYVSGNTVAASVQLLDTDDNNRVTVDWYPSATLMSAGPIFSGMTDSSGAAVASLSYGFAAEQYYPVVKATDANGNQAIDSCATRLGSSAPGGEGGNNADNPPLPSDLPLNDTGITSCAGYSNNELTCPVLDLPDQDAEIGRDAMALGGSLSKEGGGAAGFDFTKLDRNGDPLPANATDWSCVRDNHTGLIWEVKTNDGGLSDKDNTYTWYDPSLEGNTDRSAGIQNGGTCSVGGCDTHSYIEEINSRGLCGASDWRLPEIDELNSIIHYGRIGPAIDIGYFPNIGSAELTLPYWSGTLGARVPDTWNGKLIQIMGADFFRGRGYVLTVNDTNRIRLVR